jgi:RNA methyltransferase, TrmH family
MVVGATRLHDRRGRVASGTALLEGPLVVAEAVAAGADVDTVFATADDPVAAGLAESAGARLVVVGEAAFGRITTTTTPQSPAAVVRIPPPSIPRESHLLVAWGLSDPGNAGTLIRVAAAFGFAFVAGPRTVDLWGPKVLRSAAGAHFHTSIGSCDAIDDLRAAGRRVVGAVPRGGEMPGPFASDTAVLIGSESHGLPDDVVAACDALVTIPMASGSESLNAAIAGAIIAFAAGRGHM